VQLKGAFMMASGWHDGSECMPDPQTREVPGTYSMRFAVLSADTSNLSNSHDEEWRRSAARDAQRGDDTQVVGRGGDDVKDREIIPRAAW